VVVVEGRREDLKKLIVSTRGKVFTLQTLAHAFGVFPHTLGGAIPFGRVAMISLGVPVKKQPFHVGIALLLNLLRGLVELLRLCSRLFYVSNNCELYVFLRQG
jgi:hypothetical protein